MLCISGYQQIAVGNTGSRNYIARIAPQYLVRPPLSCPIVDSWIRDKGVSGSIQLQVREQGSRLFQEAKSGDVIICAKLDRMFRSARDALNVLEQFKSRGIELHFIDLGGNVGNGIGQLVFTILSAVAEQERTRIRERISEAKLETRSEGKHQGGKVAFGHSKDRHGNLIKDELQQRCLMAIRKHRDQGLSYRAINKYVQEDWQLSISHNAIRVILEGLRKTA